MSVCFLINPLSGGTKAKSFLQSIEAHIIENRLTEIKVVEIEFSNLEPQINSAKSFDTIIIGGGDGTISSLLGHLKGHPRVGIIPFGTGNDLARELEILGSFDPRSAESVLKYFSSSKTRPFILGKMEYGPNFAEEVHFTNYISFGFDAKIVCDFSKLRHSKIHKYFKGIWINRLTYVYAALLNLHLFLKSSAIVNHDSQRTVYIKRCRSIYFTNIRSFMGIGELTRSSSPFDDKIEYVLIKTILQYFSMVVGKHFPYFLPSKIESSTSWIFRNESEMLDIQIDGDPVRFGDSKEFRISTGGIVNIIVGED